MSCIDLHLIQKVYPANIVTACSLEKESGFKIEFEIGISIICVRNKVAL